VQKLLPLMTGGGSIDLVAPAHGPDRSTRSG
jgi:hypothetical protein